MSVLHKGGITLMSLITGRCQCSAHVCRVRSTIGFMMDAVDAEEVTKEKCACFDDVCNFLYDVQTNALCAEKACKKKLTATRLGEHTEMTVVSRPCRVRLEHVPSPNGFWKHGFMVSFCSEECLRKQRLRKLFPLAVEAVAAMGRRRMRKKDRETLEAKAYMSEVLYD